MACKVGRSSVDGSRTEGGVGKREPKVRREAVPKKDWKCSRRRESDT